MGRFRRVNGGYIVSRHWPYLSGCDYCTYLVAGAEPESAAGRGKPRSRMRLLLPLAGMEIIDDWHHGSRRHWQQIASRLRAVRA